MGTNPVQIAKAAEYARRAGILSVVEIGAQEIYSPVTVDLLRAAGFPDDPRLDTLAASKSVPDLFALLGIEYACIDIYQAPRCIVLDLNHDRAPPAHRGKYGVVGNLGTTEHLLNQLNAFTVIHDLAAVGGFMCHSLPMSHFWGHGFFKYDAKFYMALAKANEYTMEHMQFFDVPAPEPSMTQLLLSHGMSKVDAMDVGAEVWLRKQRDRPFRIPLDLDDDKIAPSIAPRYAKSSEISLRLLESFAGMARTAVGAAARIKRRLLRAP